jgi:PAS domain S-box-containing protein
MDTDDASAGSRIAAPPPPSGELRSQIPAALERASRWLSAGVAAVGLVVLFGWALDVPALTRLHPSLASMKPNTAVCLTLLGGALWSRARGRPGWPVPVVLGTPALAIPLVTLVEYLTGRSLGIDDLVFRVPGAGDAPARMSLATTLSLLFLGVSVSLGTRKAAARSLEQALALTAGACGFVSVLGYAYGVRSLYEVRPFASVALHTALALIACAAAIVCASPETSIARFVADDGPAGVVVRRLLPAAIVVPPALGWLRLQGQVAGLYGTEFGLAAFALSNVVVFSVLVLWNARGLQRSDMARRAAEAAAHEREEDLATTLQSIGDAVIATDAHGRITKMNPVAERLTGWPIADARGRELPDVFHIVSEDTREEVENPVVHVLRDGVVVGLANHTALIARDGTERPIADSGAPIRDRDGAIRGVVLVFRDLTAEKTAELALARTQARLDRIAESGIIGIVVADMVGNITEANDAFLDLLGYTRADLEAGRIVGSALTPPEWLPESERARDQMTASGAALPWEKELFRRDGTRVPVLIAVTKVDPPYNISLVVDLTELRNARRGEAVRAEEARAALVGKEQAEATLRITEEQLRHSQKMDAVGRLAGGVAHDFNNLLSVILSYSAMLRADVGEADPIQADLAEIERAGKRAAELTRQLLLFSRRQVVDPKVVNLNELLASITKMIGRLVGEDVNVVTLLATGLGNVRVDPGNFEHVVVNLVVNARDAMPSGGTLTLETANVDLDEDYAHNHLGTVAGPHVMLAVSDTGTGMDRETQSKIFEPFFTTKAVGKGTGLGLSTVYGIVQHSGGSVWVYSEPGKGTTFKVYLPRIDAGAPMTNAPTATAAPGGAGDDPAGGRRRPGPCGGARDPQAKWVPGRRGGPRSGGARGVPTARRPDRPAAHGRGDAPDERPGSRTAAGRREPPDQGSVHVRVYGRLGPAPRSRDVGHALRPEAVHARSASPAGAAGSRWGR